VYDEFAERFAKAVSALPVGDGLNEGIALGPLISPAPVDKVRELVADATA
jgi:succinate-semialdehyde dehydrogenase/glutarate-semialdehyde dehydrogenase